MLNNFILLTENPETIFTLKWYLEMVFFLVLLISPWIFVIFKFGIFRKLRVSFIIQDYKPLSSNNNYKKINLFKNSNKEENGIAAIYLKKGSEIILPEAPIIEGKKFVGWYIDPEFTEEYIPIPMPNYNIKLYGKYEDILS